MLGAAAADPAENGAKRRRGPSPDTPPPGVKQGGEPPAEAPGAAPFELPYITTPLAAGCNEGSNEAAPCEAGAAEKLFSAAAAWAAGRGGLQALAACSQPPQDSLSPPTLWTCLRKPPPGAPPHQLTDVACAALFAAGAADPAAAQRACAVLVARIGRCGGDGYARAALMQLFTAAWLRCWGRRWAPPGHAAVDAALREHLLPALRSALVATGAQANRQLLDVTVVSWWRNFALIDQAYCERLRREVLGKSDDLGDGVEEEEEGEETEEENTG
eukprot:Hpha_TRINITY_DN7848_c0_g2::TRINITY_DN7848_c0_g2_i1::g.185486::m.185486